MILNEHRTEINQESPPMLSYRDYIAGRAPERASSGLSVIDYETHLFDFQKPIVDWALKRGRAAIFADAGLGKSQMQIHWGNEVSRQANGPVLFLAPLAVSAQTIREGAMFGNEINRADPDDTNPKGMVITNYEHVHKFDPSLYAGIEHADTEVWDLQVLEDESFVAEGCVVHNCPLQLDVIERCLQLWTNEGDVVWSPFMGIGSEGYVSLQMNRRFIGAELKQSYFDLAVKNLENVRSESDEVQFELFDSEVA